MNLQIVSTIKSPNIQFTSDGMMHIEGRFILEDCSKFFKHLFNWLNDFSGNSIELIMKLDYLNTTATEWLYKFFHEIEQTSHIKNINIHWFIEHDDEDLLETVRVLSNLLERSMVTYDFYSD